MQVSGGAEAAVFAMLMISAVAIFFSWSGWATDLSDLSVSILLRQLRPGSDGQRLNRNGERIAPRRGGNSRSRREPRTQIRRRILDGHHHLEVFCFFAGSCLLRSGHSRGADNGVIANLRYNA